MESKPEGAPKLRRVLQAFLDGAVRPNRPAALLVLSLNLVLFGTISLLITPRAMRGSLPRYLAQSPIDYDAFATGLAHRLTRPPRDRPVLVVVGGSATREGLDSDDIEEVLRGGFAVKAEVHNVATGRQPLTDSIGIVDRLPRTARGVVVLGVDPEMMTSSFRLYEESLGRPRLGFRSDRVEEIALRLGIETPPRLGIYALDNLPYLISRARYGVRHGLRGKPLRRRPHNYLGVPPLTEKKWRFRGSRVARRFGEYDRNVELNTGLLRDMVETVRRRPGMKLVLLAPPVNPRFVREFWPPGLGERHGRILADLARAPHVSFLRTSDLAELSADDFWDWCHLRDRVAIRRCGEGVAAQVAPLLRAVMEDGTR
jgi:hypothetical protein